jgi:thiol-disulfide isomerase/thioredoxin
MTLLALLLPIAMADGPSPSPLSLVASLADGQTMPDFTVLVEGEEQRLSELGSVRVVEFGSTACRPCMAGLEHQNWLASFYEDREVTFVAVFTDDDGEAMMAALDSYTTDHLVIAQVTLDTRRSHLHGRTSYPTTFVLDPDSTVLARWTGYQHQDNRASTVLEMWFRQQKRLERQRKKAEQG